MGCWFSSSNCIIKNDKEFNGVLSDRLIRIYAEEKEMIKPFIYDLVSFDVEKKISYGVSSYGYDARLSNEFKIFKETSDSCGVILDPLNFDESHLVQHTGDYVIVPPNTTVLGKTIEYFKIPKNILAVCFGKSTYARCGLIVNVTPIEPEFEGNIVIEMHNSTPFCIKVYAYQGICQFIFMIGVENCNTTYKDRNGKYMYQTGVVVSR